MRAPTSARIALPLLVGAAIAINLPYLGGGFACDDLLLIEAFEEDPRSFTRWRGVWSIDDIDAFRNSWWTGADFRSALWRPLPSAIFEGSLALFGQRAFPLHLLALVLHGLVATGLWSLVRGLRPDRPALALVAALLFLLCEDHSMGVGWIATFTDMLCVVFVLASLLAHRAWLARRRPAWLLLGLVLLLPAFASKESAALAPLFAAWLGVLAPDGRARLDGSLLGAVGRTLGRPLDWLPHLALMAAYLGAYRLFDLGGMHSLAYLDPMSEPARYLHHMVLHLPTLWLGTLTPIPPSISLFFPPLLPWAALGGAVLAAACVLAGRALWRDPLVLFGAGLYLLALLPQVSTDASERALYLPFVGAAPVLAVVLLALRDRAAPLALRLLAGSTALGLALPGALMSLTMPWSYVDSLAAPERHALTAAPHVQETTAPAVLLLTTPGMFDTLYPAGVLAHHLGPGPEVYLLSSANAVFTIERTGPRAFLLRTDRPGWLSNYFARLTRTPGPLAVGQEHRLPPFTARIEALTADGEDVTAVHFELHQEALLLSWGPEGYAPLDLDALPPGEEQPLTDSSDLWSSMM